MGGVIPRQKYEFMVRKGELKGSLPSHLSITTFFIFKALVEIKKKIGEESPSSPLNQSHGMTSPLKLLESRKMYNILTDAELSPS